MSSFLIVAIDGGAASGKSSTSRALSERFNFLHVDTGSYYRAITAEFLRRGLRVDQINEVKTALSSLALGTQVDVRTARMQISGRVVPESEIRGPEVTAAVPHFAAMPEVRTALLTYQRSQADVAQAHNFCGLIMEGRDIGSVIFPNADLRFFLHADVEARTRRRSRRPCRRRRRARPTRHLAHDRPAQNSRWGNRHRQHLPESRTSR